MKYWLGGDWWLRAYLEKNEKFWKIFMERAIENDIQKPSSNNFGQIPYLAIMTNINNFVEFAKEAHEKQGLSIREAAVSAAKLRFRAIMMTELALIIGVLPMIFASGAGANSRISVGSTVFGGMVAACTLGAVMTPGFYVLVQEFVDKFPKKEITDKDLEIDE